MTTDQHGRAERFRQLHAGPAAFVIANPWDAGSARLLAGLGFEALATSSGAAAGVLGRRDGQITRAEAIAHAGGLLEYADGKNIVVLRSENGQERNFKFNYKDVVKGKNLQQNILLKPGDTIVVP